MPNLYNLVNTHLDTCLWLYSCLFWSRRDPLYCEIRNKITILHDLANWKNDYLFIICFSFVPRHLSIIFQVDSIFVDCLVLLKASRRINFLSNSIFVWLKCNIWTILSWNVLLFRDKLVGVSLLELGTILCLLNLLKDLGLIKYRFRHFFVGS